MDCSTPGFPVHHQLPELAQTHVYWVGDAIHHLILCHPLLLLPSILPSIRVFSNESVLCIRWPNSKWEKLFIPPREVILCFLGLAFDSPKSFIFILSLNLILVSLLPSNFHNWEVIVWDIKGCDLLIFLLWVSYEQCVDQKEAGGGSSVFLCKAFPFLVFAHFC